jgi:hypothetical protein
MKKLTLLLVAFHMVLLSAVVSSAQHQRLAVKPGTITLNGQKRSLAVEAFCLDRNRVIDGTYNYNNLLSSSSATATVGGRTLPLQKAINEGLVRIESTVKDSSFDSGIGIRFVNLSEGPLTIHISDSLPLGEKPGVYTNRAALEVVKTDRSSLEGGSREVQDLLWEADIDRVRWESLGYKSLEEFQQANNVPLNGLSAATKAKLEDAEAKLIARFEAAGINERRPDTTVQSVFDNISSFQYKIGVKETGIYSPDVRSRFERYEGVDFPEIRKAAAYNSAEDNYLFLRVTASRETSSLYSVYSPERKLYEGNSVAEIEAKISEEAPIFGKTYVELDFPSKNQADAFKASFDISRVKSEAALVEGTPALKNVFFSNNRTFEIGAISEPILEGRDYVQTIGLNSTARAEVNKSWKLKAASSVKQTVMKFTNAVKNLVGRKDKQGLADIVEKARVIDDDRTADPLDVKVSLIDEFGEIRVSEISLRKLIRIIAED